MTLHSADVLLQIMARLHMDFSSDADARSQAIRMFFSVAISTIAWRCRMSMLGIWLLLIASLSL